MCKKEIILYSLSFIFIVVYIEYLLVMGNHTNKFMIGNYFLIIISHNSKENVVQLRNLIKH